MQKCDNEHFSKKLYQFLGVITRSLTIKIIFNYIRLLRHFGVELYPKEEVKMNKIIDYFKNPFTRLPEGCLFGKARWFDLLLRIVGYLDLLLLPLYGYLTLEFIHYSSLTKFKHFMTTRTTVVLFGIFVVYLLFFLILMAVKKGFVAGIIFSIIIGAASVANYYKYVLTGENLFPWDIVAQGANAGEAAGFISTPFPWWAWVLMIGLVIATAVLFFTKPEVPLKAYVRFPIIIIAVIFAMKPVNTPEKVNAFLNARDIQLEDMALQESNYIENGFTGAFVVNVLSSNVTPPKDYSQSLISSILEKYPETEATKDFSSPDIILILAESFWDVRQLPGVEFSQDPLENYDEILSRENTVSGRFFTTAYGGGTVKPEFEVLTGLTTDRLPAGSIPWQYITNNTESYVSLYQDLGYDTVLMHPYNSNFYQRKQTYPRIGFNKTYFDTYFYEHPEIQVQIDGKQIADSTLVDHIKSYLDSSDIPVFMFGISMENHQPYANKFGTHTVTVSSDRMDAGVLSDVENYTQGVYHADLALKELVDYIDSRERDTVLVWFGDHLPTLGANYAAYAQSGMVDLGVMNVEMKESLQSTPYLIYSNFETSEDAMVSAGQGNDISSYNLMNALATLIGAPRTPLMYFLEDFYNVYPYYNVRLYNTPFPEGITEYIDAHAALTYDRTVGKRYSLK